MSAGSSTRPLPEVDATSAPFWDATRERRFVVQRCGSCSAWQHYPRPLCVHCGGDELTFQPATGQGSIYSFTVVHRSPLAGLTPPYVVALVRLDEGPVLLTNVVGMSPDEVRCDQPVTVAWEPLGDGRHLPVFRPTATEETP